MYKVLVFLYFLTGLSMGMMGRYYTHTEQEIIMQEFVPQLRRFLTGGLLSQKFFKTALAHPFELLKAIKSAPSVSSQAFRAIIETYPDNSKLVVAAVGKLRDPKPDDLNFLHRMGFGIYDRELYSWALSKLLDPILQRGSETSFRKWLDLTDAIDRQEFGLILSKWHGSPKFFLEAESKFRQPIADDILKALQRTIRGHAGLPSPLLWSFVKDGQDTIELQIVERLLLKLQSWSAVEYCLFMLDLNQVVTQSSETELILEIVNLASKRVADPTPDVATFLRRLSRSPILFALSDQPQAVSRLQEYRKLLSTTARSFDKPPTRGRLLYDFSSIKEEEPTVD